MKKSLTIIVILTLTTISLAFDLRIFGGTKAEPGEFPYSAAINLKGDHHCGGAIISSRQVITAAHCVYELSASDFIVYTGSVRPIAGKAHSVSSIDIHENYDEETNNNDIAIITLNGELNLNDPFTKAVEISNNLGQNQGDAIVTGWGVKDYNGTYANRLNFLIVSEINTKICGFLLQRYNKVYDNQICTVGRRSKGTCFGDSGGPLVLNGKLIGIVSWGIPCATGFPDVYTKVAWFKEWIDDRLI